MQYHIIIIVDTTGATTQDTLPYETTATTSIAQNTTHDQSMSSTALFQSDYYTPTKFGTTNHEDTIDSVTVSCKPCTCPNTSATRSEAELKAWIDVTKQKLTLDKRTTSLYRRSLVSVTDTRVSASTIGYTGAIILSVVLITFYCVLGYTKMVQSLSETYCEMMYYDVFLKR